MSNRIRFFLTCICVSFAFSHVRAATIDEGTAATEVLSLQKNMELNQSETSANEEDQTRRIIDALQSQAEDISKALVLAKQEKEARQAEPMPFDTDIRSLATERTRSVLLANALKAKLDTVALQSVLGYTTVENVESDSTVNPYVRGSLNAWASNLYQTYIALFCIPGAQNTPSDCASEAADKGIKSGETFIDFMVGEKTWPQKTVLDVMKLARAFFGYVPDLTTIGQELSPENYMSQQRDIAINSVRMSVINYLAARRGPTSSATYTVLMAAFKNFLPTQSISSTNYFNVCNKKTSDQTMAEQYICSFTNIPEKAGDPRIISQAAIDRLMQYDFYMSPNFAKILGSPQFDGSGSLSKFEVYQLAQQVTQDYRQLEMLKMHTVMTAMSFMNQGGT